MTKKIIFILFLAFNSSLFAQKEYFQQQVNYKINVVLDDKKHSIKGDVEMEYINNSPDELNEIWIHLWGNAYKNQKSAYAKQQLNQGKTKFFAAKNEDLGFYKDLDFKIDNQTATWNFDPKNPDIAVVKLKNKLKKGEKINISSPFELKIPASFSRLGHVGTSYQMTQWYPKPAVYDSKGWHPIPYLNQGEFYSEFGNYDVSITLPENYVVGATGMCQQPSEYVFLEKRFKETEEQMKKGFDKSTTFPESATTTKTLRYLAENVHDFAWFADKRFWVLKNQAILDSGKKVDCWAMFTNTEAELWKKGADYVVRSVKFYSNHVGEYPYPHATAVQSALSAGGGMEYPMITVIDKAGNAKSLDIVITHEVGHNWFYGILASNERDHGWMDEGMNTYYERRYTQTYYPKNKISVGKLSLDNDALTNVMFDYIAKKNEDQAPNTTSADLLPINYGTCMYQKSGKSMEALEGFLGTETYDQIMKEYFQKWKFKHPYPEDFRAHWEKSTNKKIAWFFDGLINSNEQTNMTFAPVKNENNPAYDLKLNLKSTGIDAPIPVSGIKDGKIVVTKYFEKPSPNSKTFEVTFPKGDYDKVMIDAEGNYPQPNRYNTTFATTGKPLSGANIPRFTILNLIPKSTKRFNIGVLPAVAFNYYDKMQLGLAFYSAILPNNASREINVVPLYSFKTKQLNGVANLRQSWYMKKGPIARVDFKASAKGFSNDHDLNYGYYDRYVKSEIGGVLGFRKSKLTATKSSQISARYVQINNFYHNNINFKDKIFKDTASSYGIAEVKYTLKNDFVLSPSETNITLQTGKGFTKIFADYKNKIQFERKHEALYLHAFGGFFLKNNNPTAYVPFQSSGHGSFSATSQDYMYDNYLLARSQREPKYYYRPVGGRDTIIGGGWRSNQIYMQDAGVRTVGTFGTSNTYMLGGGLAYNLPLPFRLGIRPYIDAVIYPDNKKAKIGWVPGIAAVIVPDIFEIYFPIPKKTQGKWETVNSSDLFFNKREKYTQRIAFMLNINKLNPYTQLEKVSKAF